MRGKALHLTEPPLYKICPGCKQNKSRDEFYPIPSRSDFLSSYCIPCQIQRGTASTKKARGEKRPEYLRSVKNWRLKTEYGITIDDFNSMFIAQEGRCAICHRSGQNLGVDHDHVTGQVRALLCFRCNILLGWIELSPENVNKGVEYLNEWYNRLSDEQQVIKNKKGG